MWIRWGVWSIIMDIYDTFQLSRGVKLCSEGSYLIIVIAVWSYTDIQENQAFFEKSMLPYSAIAVLRKGRSG